MGGNSSSSSGQIGSSGKKMSIPDSLNQRNRADGMSKWFLYRAKPGFILLKKKGQTEKFKLQVTNKNEHQQTQKWKLTYSNDPTDWEARTLRVVAVDPRTRETATLTAILTSASQNAASPSPSNASHPRLWKNEEQARVCTAGLFPLWELLTF